MCGIVGICAETPDPTLQSLVEGMNDLQHHRGPDGGGVWSSQDARVHFGHRRLAIIDLSHGADQPMVSWDQRFVLVFNGEIYNYLELKQACLARGSRFRTASDTEVIIEYIRHFGALGLKDFRGMWAFVLYDTHKNTLLVSRDPFGIKPLHYGLCEGRFYFASEIKSLRKAHPTFAEIDPITERFFLDFNHVDLGPWTFFKNVLRFPAASYAEISLDRPIEVRPVAYWEPPGQQTALLKEAEVIDCVRALLRQSVKRHRVSDVPLAFCLSGGLDSSALVCLVSEAMSGQGDLSTFTTHYPSFPKIDETKWARFVVSHTQAKAHWVAPSCEDFMAEFDGLLEAQDEPIGSTSMYSQNAIFQAISKAGLKVSLDGQGADELFGGYHSYYYFHLKSLLKQGQYKTFLSEAGALMQRFPFLMFEYLEPKRLLRVFKKHRVEVTRAEDYMERLDYIRKGTNTLLGHLESSLLRGGLPTLLRYADRTSMRHGVESRVPFLDVDLVNYVHALPDHFKIRHGITKFILRKAMVGIMPTPVIERKDKLGFPAPEKFWVKQGFGREINTTRDWRLFVLEHWRRILGQPTDIPACLY